MDRQAGSLLSVNVGMPRDVSWQGRTVRTAVWKRSCRTGVCHTCESGLVSGQVGYAPEPVDDPADGDVLICCSQPRGDLALDLLGAQSGDEKPDQAAWVVASVAARP
jgi:hypothetical protein